LPSIGLKLPLPRKLADITVAARRYFASAQATAVDQLDKIPGLADATPDKSVAKARLKAWWYGTTYISPAPSGLETLLEPQNLEEDEADAASEELANFKATVEGWSPQRVKAAQMLFGTGYAKPGGDEMIRMIFDKVDLAKGLTVFSKSNKLTEIGSGLGGAAELIATESGANVAGLETDPNLLAAARIASTNATDANFSEVDFDNFKPRKKSADAIISFESLFAAPKKEKLIKSFAASLKPGGRLILTDFALSAPEERAEEEIIKWASSEPQEVDPWTLNEWTQHLESNGLSILSSEDITDKYKKYIFRSFLDYSDFIQNTKFDETLRLQVMAEGQLWADRIAAFESGKLQLMFIYARMTA